MSDDALSNDVYLLIRDLFKPLYERLTSDSSHYVEQYVISQLMLGYVDNSCPDNPLEPVTSYREIIDGEVDGLRIYNKSARVFISGKSNFHKTSISGSGDALVFFGTDCDIKSTDIACHAKSNVFVAGYNCRLDGLFVHSYGPSSYTILGPGVTSQSGCNVCVQEGSYVLIGRDSMLSTNVFIRTSDSHGIYDQRSRTRLNPARPVIIHQHVWISRSTTINKGTEIGAGSIVGQGSVVHGRLVANSIYAGAPVERVRADVLWDRKTLQTLSANHDSAHSHFTSSFVNNSRARIYDSYAISSDLAVASSAALANQPSATLRAISTGTETEKSWLIGLATAKAGISALYESKPEFHKQPNSRSADGLSDRPNVACLMMQKDEKDLLPSWINYYSSIFGINNLYIWDNGSSDKFVIDYLKDQEHKGLHVEWSMQSGVDFRRKGAILGDKIRSLQRTGEFDFFAPIDCDEFLTLDTPDGPSCEKDDIISYFSLLSNTDDLLGINACYANVLGEIDKFWKLPHRKSLFRSGTFKEMDHGYHYGETNNSKERLDTRFTFLHFHYKPYRIIREHSLNKLRPYIDTQDEKIIAEAAKTNRLAKIVSGGSDGYRESFPKLEPIVFKGIYGRLERMGVSVQTFLTDTE